ncbi:MAG: hypothetical protein M1827_001583 [Pycnora praestabilis]|nr:MAG: hypothetical protein M1827_001583 [Pycnora praestabilis]
MAAEVYRRVGRGGAGNYYSQKDVQDATKRTAEDLEAAKTTTASTSDEEPPQVVQDYAHMGRGGAGNYYSPPDLQQNGTFAGSNNAGEATAAVSEGSGADKGYRGRGGAGNYIAGNEETRKVEAEKQAKEMQEGVHVKVMQDVEAGLAPPPKAHLGQEFAREL